jgi:DNA-binding Lrp family transcriptional regulator
MDADVLRVIAEPDPLVIGRGMVLHAWVRCRSGCVSDVAEHLSRLDTCQLVVTLAGSADLMAELTLADAADMPDVVTRLLPSINGVEHVEARLVLRPFRRAGQWRIQACPNAEADLVPLSQPSALSPQEQAMTAHLMRDGRASLAELAMQAGVSEPTAHRMLQSLIDRRALSFRVEVEPALVGFPVEALIAIQARPQAVEALAGHLARPAHALPVRDKRCFSAFLARPVPRQPSPVGCRDAPARRIGRRSQQRRQRRDARTQTLRHCSARNQLEHVSRTREPLSG